MMMHELAKFKFTRTQIISNDQILAQSIKARGRTIRYDTHKLINAIWNKEELPEELHGVTHCAYVEEG
jgi:hypothetical protein